jgi:hypothetical protein
MGNPDSALRMAAEAASHRSRTPLADQRAGEGGQQESATRGVNQELFGIALQTPGRCTLALTTIRSAMSGSAARST